MIVRKRSVQGGQPVIDGTRLPVAQMREAYDAAGRRYLSEQYDMTRREIDAALGHRWRYWWLHVIDYMWSAPEDVWERSRWYWLGYSLLFIGQGVVIGWLLT